MTRERFKQLKSEGRIQVFKNLTPPTYYVPESKKQVKCLMRLQPYVVEKVLQELGYVLKMTLINEETCYRHIFKRRKFQVFLQKKFTIDTATCRTPDVPFGYYHAGYKFQPLYFRTWTKKA